MLWIVPLLFALLLLLPVVLSPVSTRASLIISRIAIPVFGFYVANQSPRRAREVNKLQAAHVGTTHRVYAARTLLMATIVGLVGSVLGVYLAGWLLLELAVQADAIESALPAALSFLAGLARLQQLGFAQLFSLLLFSGATVGTVLAVGTYWGRWVYLDQKAQARAGEIDASLPRTVAFIYALSRSGMSFPQVLETLTNHQDVYGESAREIGVAVRDMDAFGTDVLTALREIAERTPSDGMEEFAENLASVLASGRSLSNFLREQYERYQEEAESLQQQYLDLLSTFAEVYVTVLVAGPLFFITVLVVIGLVIEDTLPLIRIVTYAGVPLGTIAFVVYLDSMTEGVRNPRRLDDVTEVEGLRNPLDSIRSAADQGLVDLAGDGQQPRSDGGAVSEHDRENYERLEAYDRFAWLRSWVDDPLDNVLDRPAATLLVTVPLALVWLTVRADLVTLLSGLTLPSGGISFAGSADLLRAIDEPVIEATVLVLFVASLVHELRKRRIQAIESAVPDWLDRLASVNEAGLTIVESIQRIADSDLGALSKELSRTATDIEWGADARTALRRLEIRARSAMVARSVTLITNAMSASGDIGPVLRIAANEAQDTRRLRRERRQEMVTYLFVIYISFFVFLGIIVALSVAFIPAIESAAASTGTGGATGGNAGPSITAGPLGGLREVNTAGYQLIFFHVTAIQAVCSGIVAGQLGESRPADGMKHATIMLVLSYLVFQFI